MIKNKHVAAFNIEYQQLIHKCYPPFIWQNGKKELSGYVPVFTFHTIMPDEFEEKLRFLKDNDYYTATTDEIYEYIQNGAQLPPRTIMLTFDDGRKSVWAIIYPLLKKYGLKAAVFLVPDILRKDDGLSPNLEDLWNGRCDEQAIVTCDQTDEPTISWKETSIMHNDGTIDFQAHTVDHRKIPVSPRIVNFINPQVIKNFYFNFDIPILRGAETNFSQFNQYLGTPIYESVSPMEDRLQYLEDIQLRKICLDHVGNNGGGAFFQSKNWYAELTEVVKEYRKKSSSAASFETETQRKARIRHNLEEVKRKIEDHLPGKKVYHISYPWGGGSDLSVKTSKEIGYRSNYWSHILNKSKNYPGCNPYYLVRLKHDFIWRLPGAGRKTLRKIFLFKFLRRAKGQLDY